MTPPLPAWRVDMRSTASREHSNVPITFTANTRSKRPASMSSRRVWRSRMPALLTSAVAGPSFACVSSKSARTSASRAMSAAIATAFPPAAAIAPATSSAPLRSLR